MFLQSPKQCSRTSIGTHYKHVYNFYTDYSSIYIYYAESDFIHNYRISIDNDHEQSVGHGSNKKSKHSIIRIARPVYVWCDCRTILISILYSSSRHSANIAGGRVQENTINLLFQIIICTY